MFLGQFDHSLDTKRRLAIPAEIRDSIPTEEHGAQWVALPGSNGHLWLWPSKLFESVVRATPREFLRDQRTVNLDTQVMSKAAKIELDSAGRVRIPDRLLESYGLKDKVTVLGVFDHLEVVDSEQWKQESMDTKEVGQLYGAALEARRADRP
jgi:MraZ protein